MTSEYLLDSVGLIDDDLIQDAEVRPAPKVIPWRRLSALAACLALALTLGYGLTHLGMGGAGSAPAGSDAAQNYESAQDSASPAEPTAPSGGCSPEGALFLDGIQYRPTGETVPELPGGSREIGTLSALSPGAPSPSTDAEDCVGCLLFEGPDGTMYVQLAEDCWAVAELVQP